MDKAKTNIENIQALIELLAQIALFFNLNAIFDKMSRRWYFLYGYTCIYHFYNCAVEIQLTLLRSAEATYRVLDLGSKGR